MKKSGIRMAALFCLFVLLVSSIPFADADETVFIYKTDATDNAIITGATGLNGVCRIPGQLDGHTVTGVAAYACNGNTVVTELIFPDSIQRIEAGAFEDCSSLSEVTLPSSLTFLGASAFAGTALTSVEIPASLEECETDGGFLYVFNGQTHSVTKGPFAQCDKLKYAAFENGMTYIPDGLFAGCTGLETIAFPDSTVYIGENVCRDCLRLTTVIFSSVTEEICASAFADCVSLTELSLPSALRFLGGGAFAGTAVEDITIPAALQTCETGDLSFYTWNGKKYSVYAGPFGLCDSLKTIHFAENLQTIPEYLFAGCTGLESVSFPGTVTAVGDGVFQNCLRLQSVTFGGAEKSIGQSAFRFCVSLTEISIPDSVTQIGDGCFADCTALTEIHLPAQLKAVRPSLFRNCTALQSVSIPAAVTSIGAYAFRNCSVLSVYNIPNGCTAVGAECFAGCKKTEEITFPDSVTEIGKGVCQGCSSLCRAKLGKGIAVIAESAFRDCPNLSQITLTNSVKSIEKQAFLNDTSLETITVPSSVADIDKTAFAYSGLQTIQGVSGSAAQIFASENGFRFTECEESVITVGNVNAVTDSTVCVPVYVKNNHGFSYLKLTFSFDAAALTLYEIQNGTVSSDEFTFSENRAIWDSVNNTENDGLLALLRFRVAENAEQKAYTIGVRMSGCFDADEKSVSFMTENGSIAVSDFLYGDVNADGTVDGKDLIRLRRYLADLDFETGLSSVSVCAGADCNADGKTDVKDVVLLRQYLLHTDDDTLISDVVLGKQK